MNRIPVTTSSSIAAIGYDKQTRHMEVEFTNGRVYRYKKVPLKKFNNFLAAGSMGKFFHNEIRSVFEFDEITMPQEVPIQEKIKRSLDM